jgi:nitroimidazol reductase NimA-like FMN-containing flavoprotein (pyridoxamine 5'-phosphate oxidase superfamily)
VIEVDRAHSDARESIEVLSADESAELLRGEQLGRIAIVVDGRPEIFPVNYAFDAGVVVFRTAPGLKLERAPLTRAAFEVDGVDAEAGIAWSVVLKGTVYDITTTIDRLSEHLRQLVVRPAAPGERSEWLAVYSDSITGRRFSIATLEQNQAN